MAEPASTDAATLEELRAEVASLRMATREASEAVAASSAAATPGATNGGVKLVSQDTTRAADDAPTPTDLKDQGNKRFKGGDFSGALALYSRALLRDPQNHLLYSNRAACQLRLDQMEAAVADARKALEHCPQSAQPYVKGYHRLTQALVALERFDDARRAIEHGLRLVTEGDNERAEALMKMLAEADAKREAAEAAALQREGLRNAVDPRRKPKVREFEPLEELGHGNFSTIVRAAHRITGEPFAMKIIHKRDVEKTKRRHPNVENEIQMEKKVLLRCRGHANILYLYHTLSDYNSLYFLTELCAGGEVWARLTLHGRAAGVPRSLATFWAAEVVRGLIFLHSNGVVHRDMKPENLLLDSRGRVKLADFGTAKDLADDALNGPEFCGTPEYMSPEAVSSRPVGYSSDLWALGCIIYQFLAGYPPFRAHSPYLSFLRIKKGQVCYPEHLSPELDGFAHDLIQGLLKLNPDERSGATEGVASLTAHPFFQGSDRTGAARPNPNAVTIAWSDLDRLPCEPHLQVTHVCDAAVNARSAPDVNAPDCPVPFPREALAAVVTQPQAMEAETQAVAVALLESLEQPGLPEELTARIAQLDEYHLASARMVLRQHGRLHEKKVWKALHRGAPLLETRALRASAHTREYVGMEKQQHGSWVKPFYFVSVSGPASDDDLLSLMAKLNRLRPAPAFLIYTGGGEDPAAARARRKLFLKLSVAIPVLFVPGPGEHDTTAFGAAWYGFWFQGFRGLVIDSNLLMAPERKLAEARRMEDWLDEQLEQSKLASRRACIFSHHPWFLHTPDEENAEAEGRVTIPLPKRARWLNRFSKEDIDTGVTSGSAGGAGGDVPWKTEVRGKVLVPEARQAEPIGAPRDTPAYNVKLGAYVLPNREAIIPGGPGEEDEKDRKERMDALIAEDAGKPERKARTAPESNDDSGEDSGSDASEEGEAAQRPHCVIVPPLSSGAAATVLVVTVARYETARQLFSLDALPEVVELPYEEEER